MWGIRSRKWEKGANIWKRFCNIEKMTSKTKSHLHAHTHIYIYIYHTCTKIKWSSALKKAFLLYSDLFMRCNKGFDWRMHVFNKSFDWSTLVCNSVYSFCQNLLRYGQNVSRYSYNSRRDDTLTSKDIAINIAMILASGVLIFNF
jgi:hypothetical protein